MRPLVPATIRATGIALVLAGALQAAAQAEAFRYVSVGAGVPALTLGDLDGRGQVVPRRGQPTVMIFWRPGQAMSEAALGDLEALLRAPQGRGLEVAAIAQGGSDPEASRAAARRHDLRFLLDQGGRAAEAWGVIVYPSTAVIGADGRLVAYLPSRPPAYAEALQREATRARAQGESAAAGPGEAPLADRAQAAYKRGVALADERRWDAAAAAFTEALVAAPEHTDARLRLGYVELELGEPARALESFGAVLGTNPASPGARVGAGIARLRLGEVDAGIRLLEEAVSLNPEPVRAHYELARAYQSRGDHVRALDHYRRAYEKLLQGRK